MLQRRIVSILLTNCRPQLLPQNQPTFTQNKKLWLQNISTSKRYLHQHEQKHTRSTLGETMVTTSLWHKLFGKYLLATNIISSGVLMVVGDLMAQEIELRRHGVGKKALRERYDGKRLYRMFIVGALQGPLHHYVYRWMDRLMPVANFKNSVVKILVDQLFMSPLCILIFFYSACALENKCLEETNRELLKKFPPIYLMDWLVWPGAQYINFRYLDPRYRVIFVNVCTAVYDIFLSYMKHEYGLDS